MSMLEPRFHSFSTGYQQSLSGWDFCMSKAYCKWPVIAGIVIVALVLCLTLFCCIRCCTRRRSSGARNRAKTSSMFNAAPYQGYQPANNPHNAAPPYGEPTRFAQFDTPSRKITEDSLPAMPSWDSAQNKRVEQESEDVEMGRLEKPLMGHKPMENIGANAYSANLVRPELESHQMTKNGQTTPHYTGPDFGDGTGHAYTGPDFGGGHGRQTTYSAYAPTESTNYEPSGVNEPHELGTTYSNLELPLSPSAHQQSFGQGARGAPSVLQAGRRPARNGDDTFRDI